MVVREGEETSPRLSSSTSCHFIPHEEEFPKETRLAGGEGKEREAEGRVSATHSSLDLH